VVRLRSPLSTVLAGIIVPTFPEGFSHFVTSMTAPVASGWSVRWVGLAPTGMHRLTTAHTQFGHSMDYELQQMCTEN
jgi:hypothetical protein